MQKFCYDLKKTELKNIVQSVRSRQKQVNGPKKREQVNIEFSWRHYVRKGGKNKFITVRISQGGGLRRNRFNRDTKLSTLLGHIENVFFPNGKSKENVCLNLMEVSLVGTTNEKVEDLSLTLEEYAEKYSLKIMKFYLHTKPLVMALTENMSSSDSSDFEITQKKKRDVTGVISPLIVEQSKIAQNESLTSSNIIKKNDHSKPITIIDDLNERKILMAEQDEAFEQSLLTDREKDREKEEKVRVMEEWEKQQEQRKRKTLSLLKEEPTLEDDCVLVAVNHIARGRVQRLFCSNDQFLQVYIWIWSMTESNNFSLSFNPTSYIHPQESIKLAERRIISMQWTDDVVFQVDDASTPSSSSTSTSTTSSNSNLHCPICGEEQPVTEIEEHASSCANNTFVEVIESDNDSEDLEEPSFQDISSTKQVITDDDELVEKLKATLGKASLGATGVSLKVRRNHMFGDFCKRFNLPWVRKNLGSIIVVTFYGESGVDQGGLRREFFSDAMEEGKQMLFTEMENGFIPRTNCYGDIANGIFKLFGELIASSIIMNGPAPNFFAKWVFEYFIHGTKHIFSSGVDMSRDSPIGEFYYNLKNVTEEETLRSMVTSDIGIDILCQIGFKGVPHKVKIEDKDAILRSILLKERLQPLMIVLDQVTEGLRLYGILDMMRSQPSLFEYVFCMNKSLDWTFEKFEKFVIPQYSENGSSKKLTEIDTFQAFMEFMESLFYEENDEHIQLGDVIKFLCGVKSIPPLGLPSKLSVLFKHWCAGKSCCKCKPSVSTCSLSLTLPVHYKSADAMKEAFFDALKMTQGFDL